jgi:hypothetical protein
MRKPNSGHQLVGDAMKIKTPSACLLGILVALLASVALAQEPDEPVGRHCLEGPDARWVGSHLVVGRFNPLGILNSFRLGLCLPLIKKPGLLFRYTHLQFGAVNNLTPAYTNLGGYLQISPLSFLKLRAELTGLVMWPFPRVRAAYHGVDSYDASLEEADYPADDGESASGWNANLIATLQLRVPRRGISLILVDMFSIEYWRVGDEPYYVNLRHDLIAAKSDWILSNEVFLVLQIPWSPTGGVRAGIYDSINHLPASGHLSNHLGVVVMLYFLGPGDTVGKLEPFVRFGYYLGHPLREGGITGFAGVSLGYDFGRL